MLSENNRPLQAPLRASTAPEQLAAGEVSSSQALDFFIARGRRLRSQAILRFITTLGHRGFGLAKRMRQVHRRWSDARRAEHAMRGLDAHLRRDIGIDEHQISALAGGLEGRPTVAPRRSAQVRELPVRDSGVVASNDSRVERAA
ncbi:MAG: hypothetical protein ACI9DC_005022 [Gammaproteobacteria bacterium]|jgi:uncharacterized protein YjiS (DUF1127 family)